MYEGGRPNRLARTLNGLWGRLATAGIAPARLSTLEVRGRKSGREVSFPVVVADLAGERYLVAMLGEGSNWAKNVRAADGEAILIHGRRESARLREVEPDERAPILRHYLRLAPGARAHFPIGPESDLAAFERIAPDYPVFRVSAG
jgi:deazaflavin-dependent oxidoreductase (nitroreductase family)